MKIAIACADITPIQSQGGIAVYTRNLATGLSARGHELTILGRGDLRRTEAVAPGLTIEYLPDLQTRFTHPKFRLITDKLARSRALASHLRSRTDFDVVEFPVWDAEGWHSTRLHHFKSVVRGHTPHLVVNELARASGQRVAKLDIVAERLERAAAHRADLYLANSESSRQTAINRFGIPASKVDLCLHGVPSQSFRTNLRTEGVRVLFVGRLEVRKGVLEMFRAIPTVLKKYPNTRFEIVGSDSTAEPGSTFEQVFRRQNSDFVQSSVTFHGRLSSIEIDALRRECQIALLPSRYESFGLVHAEAMSFGLPVVAFDISATREVVDDGKTGILVPDGDAASLADAVARLVGDAELREQLGLAAYETSKSKFSIEAMSECVECAYLKLVGRSS